MRDALTAYLLDTSLHAGVIQVGWVWACAETLHFIGLCLLMGSIVTADLAIAGFVTNIKVQVIKRLLKIAMVGFAVNLITGTVFLAGDPTKYLYSIVFLTKLLLIVLIGCCAIYFSFLLSQQRSGQLTGRTAAVADQQFSGGSFEQELWQTSLKFRIIGLSSLLMWTLVLISGRLIPYLA